VPTSVSHLISDIIDSHCHHHHQQVISQPVSHVASDNSSQSEHRDRDSCVGDGRQQLTMTTDHHRPSQEPRRQAVSDGRQQLAMTTDHHRLPREPRRQPVSDGRQQLTMANDHHRPPREPRRQPVSDDHQQLTMTTDHHRPSQEPRRQAVVIFTDENDRNCMNLSKPQHYRSAAWQETDVVNAGSGDDNRSLREHGKQAAERNVKFDENESHVTQAVCVDIATCSRPVHTQHGRVSTQPHTDSHNQMAMQHRYSTVQYSGFFYCPVNSCIFSEVSCILQRCLIITARY